jgi:hypothetical protein
MDLYRAIWRCFWAGLWGFCVEFGCEMVCRWMEFGVRTEIRIWAWVVAVPYEHVKLVTGGELLLQALMLLLLLTGSGWVLVSLSVCLCSSVSSALG